jgi:hypothetical protein
MGETLNIDSTTMFLATVKTMVGKQRALQPATNILISVVYSNRELPMRDTVVHACIILLFGLIRITLLVMVQSASYVLVLLAPACLAYYGSSIIS